MLLSRQPDDVDEDEQTESERNLEQYEERARILQEQSSAKHLHLGADIGDADDVYVDHTLVGRSKATDLYVNTTSLSKSKALPCDNSENDLATCSPKRQEMSFSQRLDDTATNARVHHEESMRFGKASRHSERVGHRAGS